MTDNLDTTINQLKKEIREKDELISFLQQFSLAAMVLPSFLHNNNNKLLHLSSLLFSHFAICREKGVEKYVDNIASIVDELHHINERMHFLYHGWREEDKVNIPGFYVTGSVK